jgi:hypothetical protein
MQAIQRLDPGIELRFDDTQWSVVEPAAAVAGTHTASPEPAPGERSEWIARRAIEAGLARSAARIDLERHAAARTGAIEPATAPQVSVTVLPGESAVLLVECEGVVAWVFPDRLEAAPAARVTHVPGMREVHFTVLEPARVAAAGAGRRAAFADWIVGVLKVIVLKLVAHKVAGTVVRHLEHGRREGPVVLGDAADPSRWELPDAFPFVRATPREATRILLFVHGTFSSVRTSFGPLCATAAGRSLLESAQAHYAALWGWDHRTLSVTPRQNAEKLHAALQAITLARPPRIDVVCHSRGALVVRSLIEEVLPAKAWRPTIGRVVFAGGANAGTLLARPANWHALIDLFTNLVLAGRTALARLGAPGIALAASEALDAIADFVGYAVDAGLEEGAAPGLAALDPDGAFVKQMNARSPGEPSPRDCEYFAVESDFRPRVLDAVSHVPPEFPRRLVLLIADGFVDALMHAPNDLVVDVPSMTAINLPAHEVKEVQDFGANPIVYHTNYFLQAETLDAMARWLAIPARGAGRAAGPAARTETAGTAQ